MLADPPVSVESESVSPYVMAEADGAMLTVGIALFTVSVTVVVAVP